MSILDLSQHDESFEENIGCRFSLVSPEVYEVSCVGGCVCAPLAALRLVHVAMDEGISIL